MTEPRDTGQEGMAEALHTLTDETQQLARREMTAALREMWAKARASGPALGLLAVSGCCGLLAAASGYRLSLRLLERRLPPASAALVAALGYGAAAAGAATLAVQRLRQAPLPIPSGTARQAGQAAAAAAAEAASRPDPSREAAR
jgi:Putative Actinobacterial Holin-X, holin superfamily III